MILLTMMIVISLIDNKKSEACELPAKEDQNTMLKWAKILGGIGVFFIILAAIIVIWGACIPATATPENNFIAYLNDIGFQAFFFFGVLVGCPAVWLYSNSKDKLRDHKAIPVDLSLFRTNKGYNIGALCIIAIVALIYVVLW